MDKRFTEVELTSDDDSNTLMLFTDDEANYAFNDLVEF